MHLKIIKNWNIDGQDLTFDGYLHNYPPPDFLADINDEQAYKYATGYPKLQFNLNFFWH